MWNVLGILCFVAMIVTGIAIPSSAPEAQIPIAGLGLICFIMGIMTDNNNKKEGKN